MQRDLLCAILLLQLLGRSGSTLWDHFLQASERPLKKSLAIVQRVCGSHWRIFHTQDKTGVGHLLLDSVRCSFAAMQSAHGSLRGPLRGRSCSICVPRRDGCQEQDAHGPVLLCGGLQLLGNIECVKRTVPRLSITRKSCDCVTWRIKSRKFICLYKFESCHAVRCSVTR